MTDPSEYARQIETYLCQRNGGHLVRIVGPAFEMVRGWLDRGVPLKVAFRGIDTCCQRYEARAPRRRPIRVEFCETDVLDAFEDWRRAVGVAAQPSEEDSTGEGPRRPALTAHVERAIARLAHARGVEAASTDFDRHIDAIVRELEELASDTRRRGATRARVIARLEELDADLIRAAGQQLDAATSDRLRAEAAAELAPFIARMAPADRARALESAFHRLVRESMALPTLTYSAAGV